MPLINGMKMACEPCIRGHRSTKCNHASERLMVPVRKPGRPLSTCPHPRHQMCGCSSVTAAIPRKQMCRCGGKLPSNDESPNLITTPPPLIEMPRSPNKSTFRIEKNYQRPYLNTKAASISNLERMDANQIYVHQLSSNIPVAIPSSASISNGYHSVVDSPDGYYIPQYSNTRDNYPQAHTNFPLQSLLMDGHNCRHKSNRQSNKALCNGLNRSGNRISLASSGYLTEIGPNFTNETVFPDPFTLKLNGNARSSQKEADTCHVPRTIESGTNVNLTECSSFSMQSNALDGVHTPIETQSSCCCMPKSRDLRHRSSSNSSLETKDTNVDPCCSSPSNAQQALHQESVSTIESQSSPQNGMIFHPPLYSYVPQPSIFNNPASYGSFSNPVDASMWRMTQQGISSQPQGQTSGPSLFSSTPLPEIISAAHNCLCGTTCQCIGCVAHPYNDATQDYVRSAWENMTVEHPCPNDYSLNFNGKVLKENGNVSKRKTTDAKSSPILPPPQSPSNNEEEQCLSENDFFFINYSFPSEICEEGNCGAPCGKDCGCTGCKIHESNPG